MYVVGGVVVKNTFKVAGNIYKTADKAWEAYLHHNPNILVITEIFKQSVGKVGDKISNKVVSSKPVQKMLYLHKLNRIRNSIGVNPFYGKTFEQIAKRLEKPGGRRSQGFAKRGGDPINGEGAYLHPLTGRKYYLDRGRQYKKGFEYPHIDVHRKNIKTEEYIENIRELPKNSKLKTEKRKYPLGDRLTDPTRKL